MEEFDILGVFHQAGGPPKKMESYNSKIMKLGRMHFAVLSNLLENIENIQLNLALNILTSPFITKEVKDILLDQEKVVVL